MANVTVTTAANLIPEHWSEKTLDFRQAALIFANIVDRGYEAQVRSFGDTIHVPGIAEVAVAAKAADTAVTFTTNTESVTDIAINKNYVAAVLVENIVDVQAFIDYQGKLQGQFGYVLGKQVDADLAALPDDFTQTVGTLAVANTDEEIRRAIQYVDDADHPEDGRAWGFSPAAYMQLMGIDKYVNKDYNIASFTRGMRGMLYDIPMYVSTHVEGSNAAGHDNFLLQREALALALQQDVRIIVEESADWVGTKIVGSNIYGVKEMRDTAGVWVKGP